MAFPMKKKPDFASMLGMSPKRPPETGPPDMDMGEPEPDPGDPNESTEPGEGADTGMGIKPEAVSYRTAAQVCGSCSFMQDDGNCSKLMMPVAEGDGCNLHTPREGAETMPEPNMEEQAA